MNNDKIAIINAAELKKQRDANPHLCIIDVRELHEWQNLHIPDVIHIPLGELAARIESIVADCNQPIYLHCQAGVRSHKAATSLSELGYTQVHSLAGGISEWANCGYPVIHCQQI